jgi:hypothetical protein
MVLSLVPLESLDASNLFTLELGSEEPTAVRPAGHALLSDVLLVYLVYYSRSVSANWGSDQYRIIRHMMGSKDYSMN